MIGICDCEVQAANVNMPLYPLRAFVNSPSSLRIRNVPKKIGDWNITSVQLVAAYPDNTIKTANCKLIGCVWVGTIAGSTVTGTSENGYTIYASGIDENGNEVSNYILGKGLVEILEADGTITPGQNTAYVHLLDEEPDNPKEGDVWPLNGGYAIWQNGQINMLGLTENDVRALTEPIAADVATLQNDVNGLGFEVESIDSKIPPQASTSNKLADKAFVNSSVQTATANFRGNWATWDDVPTNANDYPVDYAGSTTPTVNDYMVVQDVTIDGKEGTWRYKYSGTWATDGKNGWLPEYQVNETPMTAAQLAALNSNITEEKVAQYDETLTNISYAFHTATKPDPYIDQSLFPITGSLREGLDFTITYSDYSALDISYSGANSYTVNYNTPWGFTCILFYTDMTGKIDSYVDAGDTVRFNGQQISTHTTVVLTIPTGYILKDRAINTLNISPEVSTYNLTFPSAVQGKARDFIVRVVAPAYTYAPAPTLSASGVTLMNAGGTMPEIATDENVAKTTLMYFSEIASNVFLVKGEAMEVIS